MPANHLQPISLDRMVNAVEKVRQRLLRAAAALDTANVPYAVTGGNAVAAWVSRVDEAAVRNTRDVDLLLSRQDLDRARAALESIGFIHRHAAGIDMFLDGPGSSAREAVHILFAGEFVRPEYPFPAADVTESERALDFQVVSLPALVRMKLTSFRRKDQVHVLDFIEVGLVDATWTSQLPPPLNARLQELLDNPDG